MIKPVYGALSTQCLLALCFTVMLAGCRSTTPPSAVTQPTLPTSPPTAIQAGAPVQSTPSPAVVRAETDKAWRAAESAHTEATYQQFAKANPREPRSAKAMSIAGRMGWVHAQNAGTTDAYQAFLDHYPNDPHAADARIMVQGQDVTLAEAVRRGWVTTRVTGDDLQDVSLTIERKVNRPLRVSVPAGTYFTSGGDAQNMVAREDNSVDLTDSTSADLSVGAACANFYLEQPDSDNTFSVRAEHPNAQLRKVLSVIDRESPSSIASQLAIWSITDNPSQDDVAGHISPAPDSDDYQQAAGLLRDAGIRPSSRLMFQGM